MSQVESDTIDSPEAPINEMPSVTNGTGATFTESTVSAEVDRILNFVDVNAFKKQDGAAAPTTSDIQPVKSTQGLEATKVADAVDETPTVPNVTRIFSDFIASATPSLVNEDLKGQLSECILDFLGVTAAGAALAPSSEPIYHGVHALNHHSMNITNGSTVITKGQTFAAHIAALLNASYGHSLDFDDTHAESSLHAGVTAIATALAEAEQQQHSGIDVAWDTVLLAILVGYEMTIRIGLGLSTASYSRGFHNTSVAGIFGCVAVLSVLRHLGTDVVMNAFGLAGSKAAGSMQYLANGSHNKRLHAGFAAHDAFLCVSLAESGVIGADAIIEGNLGLLQGYTDRDRADVDWQRMIGDLGKKWEFRDSALKPFAGCRMTHGFIELADSLGRHVREGKFAEKGVSTDGTLNGIKKIRCIMPKANMILVGQRIPNKIHPGNTVDAQFSAYYQVANATIFGASHDMAAYAPERLQDAGIRELCDRIECVVDENMKGMSCRMDVFLQDEDGNTAEYVRRELPEPLGERSHPFERSRVKTKFLGLMAQVYGQDSGYGSRTMKAIDDLNHNINEVKVSQLMGILADKNTVALKVK